MSIRGEYGKLAREVEKPKLAREASLVEQDLSTDLERRMCEEAASSKRKVDDGRAVGREVESDVEAMSSMSSSTCVDFNKPPSSTKARISLPKREFVGIEGPYSYSILQASLSLVAYPKTRCGPICWVLFQFPILRLHRVRLKRGQRKDNDA